MTRLVYFYKANLLKILESAYPIPEPNPKRRLPTCNTSGSKGTMPATKEVPIIVIRMDVILSFVSGSLNRKNDETATKAGAVYSNAVAIGIVAKSIAINMQKLKKIKLKIPVPKKYFISVSLCNVSCFGAVNNINPSRIMAEDQTRNVTTSIGASPYAYKCFTYQPMVPQSAAPVTI